MIIFNDTLDRDVYIDPGFKITTSDLQRVVMFGSYQIQGITFEYEDYTNYGLIVMRLARFKRPVIAYFDTTTCEFYTFFTDITVKAVKM